MSDPYAKAKGGRLTFKGGNLAARSKPIDKKKNKTKKNNKHAVQNPDASIDTIDHDEDATAAAVLSEVDGAEVAYTIDAAKRMKYEQLFPVEARKFSYDPVNVDTKAKSVEDALDDRVKKKADRYCK